MDIPDIDTSQSGNSVEDIPGIDISQPDSNDLPIELDTPRLDESAACDPDLDVPLDSQATSGDDCPASELRDVAATIELPQLQIAQLYIDHLRSASLDSSGMHADDVNDLRNPGQQYTLEDPSPLLRSVRHFINNLSASRKHYELMRTIEHLHRPEDQLLSFDQVKRRVRWLSGIVPVEHDMCINSCLAYTGPRETLDTCPRCGEPQYCLGTTKPQKRFTTVPIGPVIQALYSSLEVSESMHYLENKLTENLAHARLNGGILDVYDDTASGQALIDAWDEGRFKSGDVALQFSIDGAQLRANRPSEAWFFIWVIHNLPPNMRYKKAYVIPGAIIPGPKKPWDIDSYMFPSLYHIAALQREGLAIYNVSLGTLIRSCPLVVFGTADMMNSMYSHQGRSQG